VILMAGGESSAAGEIPVEITADSGPFGLAKVGTTVSTTLYSKFVYSFSSGRRKGGHDGFNCALSRFGLTLGFPRNLVHISVNFELSLTTITLSSDPCLTTTKKYFGPWFIFHLDMNRAARMPGKRPFRPDKYLIY
jgi:hypothetical protein